MVRCLLEGKRKSRKLQTLVTLFKQAALVVEVTNAYEA
jgi:hypothetical protein